MFSRILAPVDFSAASDAALDYARLFARTWDSELHLLHVASERLTPLHAPDAAQAEPVALLQIRDRFAGKDRPHRLKIRVTERASPPGAILSHARSTAADLIVMGTHGRTGVAHLVMGSVAETVVRKAPCPVLTVQQPLGDARSLTRILVPTDFSAPSDSALDLARVLQLRFGASIHVLHVLDDGLTGGPFGAEAFVTEAAEVRAVRLRDVRERLSHRVSAADRASRRVTSELVSGPVAHTIVQYADDNGFDLVVMGTHGRTGLAHLLIGSVAERVIRGAACPVLTTHGERPCVAVPTDTRHDTAAVSWALCAASRL